MPGGNYRAEKSVKNQETLSLSLYFIGTLTNPSARAYATAIPRACVFPGKNEGRRARNPPQVISLYRIGAWLDGRGAWERAVGMTGGWFPDFNRPRARGAGDRGDGRRGDRRSGGSSRQVGD
jgi:hypothetical protein